MSNSNSMTDAEYAALMRVELSVFIERVFRHLYPNTPYLPNWHIDKIAAALTNVMLGKTRRLIINVPPRSLKSVIVSIAFVAWALGLDPSKQFICASYGQDLADKLAMDCRSIMMSEWYQRLFGQILKGSRPALSDLHTHQGGGRFATSVGGVLTGRGGDIILIDDPIKPDGAMSDAERNTANDWFDNTLMSRLNDKRTGAIVIIMQRLHMNDMVGHVLESGEWEVLSMPAIAEVEERITYSNMFGDHVVVRQPGDVLHPAREPRSVLDSLRQSLGEYNFSGQYQQSPVPLGGGLVKLAWLKIVEANEFPQKYDQILQSWDTAAKVSELNDFSVCTTWGIKDKKIYLLHVLRVRMTYPELKRAVKEQFEQYKPTRVLIEDKASGTQLIQDLVNEGMYQVKGVKPEGDKIMRLVAQTAAIENGMVYLPASAPWLAEYVHELTAFPFAKFDDQVDSTSQALKWITGEGMEPGIIGYYRQLAEAEGWRLPE